MGTGCRSLEKGFQRQPFLRYYNRPGKRRRALLGSNPPRNNRLETHRNDERPERPTRRFGPPHRIDRFPHASENPYRTLPGSRRSVNAKPASYSTGGKYPSAECNRRRLYISSRKCPIEARAWAKSP